MKIFGSSSNFVTICLTVSLTFVVGISIGMAKINPEAVVGIWLLDEGRGDTAEDSSENGYDGAIKGAKWVEGKIGKALNFDKGDTVTMTLGVGTVKDKISVVMWIKFLDLSGQQNYFSIWDQSNNRYVPYKTASNEFRFWSNSWNVGSGFSAVAKTWYHVANIYDGSKVYIYIDGDPKVSQSVPHFTLTDTQQTAWVATDHGTGFLSNCMVDEVGLFKEALTEDDVKTIVNKGLAWALGMVGIEPEGKLTTIWGRLKAGCWGRLSVY